MSFTEWMCQAHYLKSHLHSRALPQMTYGQEVAPSLLIFLSDHLFFLVCWFLNSFLVPDSVLDSSWGGWEENRAKSFCTRSRITDQWMVIQRGRHHPLLPPPLPETGLENKGFVLHLGILRKGKICASPDSWEWQIWARDKEEPPWRTEWGTWTPPVASDTAVLVLGLNQVPLLTQHTLALVGAH